MKYLSIIAALTLAACAGVPPQNDVAATEAALTAADTAALAYVSLPLCGTPDLPKNTFCSDKATIGNINSARTAAYIAVKNAESVVNNPGSSSSAIATAESAAAAALATFQGIVATLNVK